MKRVAAKIYHNHTTAPREDVLVVSHNAPRTAMPRHSSLLAQSDQLNRRIVRCEACPRLRRYCRDIAAQKRKAFASETYWGKPVPNFGDVQRERLLIVGLAPAAHGANRTGRMFTGDRSGQWLYRALHKAGLANQPTWQQPRDGLALHGCAITAVCHCAPPDNKPTREEIATCSHWLDETFSLLAPRVIVALGQIAWRSALLQIRQRGWHAGRLPKFAHAAQAPLEGNRWLLASYHPSQQNTFTGRLTEPMFDAVFNKAVELLQAPPRSPT